jgi:hypothetical protein
LKRAEVVFVLAFILGFFMKLFSMVGGSALLVAASWGLMLLYFLFGYLFYNRYPLREIFARSTYSDLGATRIVMGFVAGIVSLIDVAGVLFIVQKWPGLNIITFVGTTLTILLIITYTIIAIIKESVLLPTILVRVIPMYLIMNFGNPTNSFFYFLYHFKW